MKTQDLRLGNWVYDGDKTKFPMQIKLIGCDYVYLDFEGNEGDVWESNIKDVCGIPLTEELLLKCGFKKNKNKFTMPKISYFDVFAVDRRSYGYQQSGDGFYIIVNCQRIDVNYIHQLQNLYFALSGDELEITL